MTTPRPSPAALPVGTRVVARDEVREGETVLHAPGAVGIVVRPPDDGGDVHLVRFPGGHPIALRRAEFDVLGRAKERDAGLAGGPVAPADLRSCVVYECHVGSRAYGLATESSDTDVRGIYLAPPELQWSLTGAPDRLEDAAREECFWELQRFLVLALKANPNVLECLWTPLIVRADPVARDLLAMRDAFLSRLLRRTYHGYALAQFRKLDAARAKGQDRWKQAMHLLRLLLCGAVALREGRVPVDVAEHRERLLAVREGRVPWEAIESWRDELHRDLERAAAKSPLPDRPDFARANEFLVAARRARALADAP